MSDSNNHEENQDLEPVRIIMLRDESGDHLSVEVVIEIEHEQNTYVLLTPSEPVVMILKEDTTQEDAPLESLAPSDFVGIQKNIQDALIEHNVRVEVKSDEFTLVGEPNESFYADCDVMELEDEGGSNEYLVLVEVDDGGSKYLVVMSIEPSLYPGLLTSEEEARLLTDEELESVESLFSEVLSEWAEADSEEG